MYEAFSMTNKKKKNYNVKFHDYNSLQLFIKLSHLIFCVWKCIKTDLQFN